MESWADAVEYGDDNLDDIQPPWLNEDASSNGTEDEQLLAQDSTLLDYEVQGLVAQVPAGDGRSWAQVAAGDKASVSPSGLRSTEGPGSEHKQGESPLPETKETPSDCKVRKLEQKRAQAEQNAVKAGDPIGIRAVQSILMSATQMNLSHFHTAGMAAGAASSVMPSAAEAMDSVYTKRNTSMKFETAVCTFAPYAKADIRSIRRRIVGATLGYFVITIGSSSTLLPDRENIWYEALGLPMHSTVLRFYIDYKKMQNHGLTLKMLAEEAFGDDCSWRVSPDFMGMIDIETSEHMSLWLSRMEQRVCGTPNILSCDMQSSPSTGLGAKAAVITRGTDIYALSRIPEINKKTIVSNNVAEVERMFGIEAAAYMLSKLIGPRIVSDFMTRTGTVLPFHKRDEIKSKGLLTCMGFERPKDDIRAAVISHSKIQKTKNIQIYEAIMTGVDPFMGFDIIT
jgi:hypothetical protein